MRRALLVLLCAFAWPADAHAEPSVWTRAAEPERLAEHQVMDQVHALMNEYFHLRDKPTSLRRSLLLNRARRLVEREPIASSSDPSVRYAVATIYYKLFDVDRETSLLELAIPHFEHVADSRAPVGLRADALASQAICHARLGQHEREIAAYDRALAIEPDPEARALFLANQAEGYMAMGRILRALSGYRQSLEQTSGVMMLETGVTTTWGMAVALDRSGDIDGALESIGVARSYDRFDQAIHGPGWFYVPSYDRHWYEALGHWQIARTVDEPDAALGAYESSERSWRAYIDAAAPGDPWLALAEIRLRQCEKEHQKALKAPRKRPPRPLPSDAPLP